MSTDSSFGMPPDMRGFVEEVFDDYLHRRIDRDQAVDALTHIVHVTEYHDRHQDWTRTERDPDLQSLINEREGRVRR